MRHCHVAEPGNARYSHLQKPNRVIKWIHRRPFKIRYKRLEGPVKVIAITDSAFRKEDKTGLAVKGAVIGIIQALDEQPGGDLHVLECFSKKLRRVTRSRYGAELLSLSDGVEFAKRVAVTMAELYAPNSNLDMLRQPRKRATGQSRWSLS